MSKGTGIFRYNLSALLKKRKWELDAAQMTAAEIRERLEQKNSEVQKLISRIGEVEEEIRRSRAADGVLDVDGYDRLVSFLGLTHEEFEETRGVLRKIENEHKEIVKQMQEIHQAIRTLEKHRERKRKEHEDEVVKQEMKTIDELWLMRGGVGAKR